jgi:hypothetical protein
VAGRRTASWFEGTNAPTPNDLSYPRLMTEWVEFEADETTAMYLHRWAHQRGVSVGTAAARQLRELALADAARALAAWDPVGLHRGASRRTGERCGKLAALGLYRRR